jgi:signal transduction histidine kinase
VLAANNTTATHLYRIAQEAVNNALRHSQASEICISLRQDHSQILLEVSDNGVGINSTTSQASSEIQTSDQGPLSRDAQPGVDVQSGVDADASHKARGMGLRTMQYRAGMICGTLQIEHRETGGTLVKCASLSAGEVICRD